MNARANHLAAFVKYKLFNAKNPKLATWKFLGLTNGPLDWFRVGGSIAQFTGRGTISLCSRPWIHSWFSTLRSHKNSAICRGLLPILASLLPSYACAGAENWHFKLSAASDKVLRGLELSDGHPYTEAAASWNAGSGAFADVALSRFAGFGEGSPAGAQFVADAGYGWRIEPNWSAQVMVSHYQSLGSPITQRMDYQEFALTAGWRDSLYASIAMSPHATLGTLQSTRTLAYDLVGRLPLAHGFTASAGIGYYDLQAFADDSRTYGNVGLSYQLGEVQFDVMYMVATSPAKERLKGALNSRWVSQITWHF